MTEQELEERLIQVLARIERLEADLLSVADALAKASTLPESVSQALNSGDGSYRP